MAGSRKFKGCCQNPILKKLIDKAEKKKIVAENYHIYALLQSTIVRLQVDDDILASLTKKKLCRSRNFDKLIEKRVIKNEYEHNGDSESEDILELNTFFSKMDSLSSCSIACS